MTEAEAIKIRLQRLGQACQKDNVYTYRLKEYLDEIGRLYPRLEQLIGEEEASEFASAASWANALRNVE